MTTQTEKEFYIETKHYVYVDYTIRARDKEHALEPVSYTHLTLPTKA